MDKSKIKSLSKANLESNPEFNNNINYYYKFEDKEDFEKIKIAKAKYIKNSLGVKQIIFFIYNLKNNLFAYILIPTNFTAKWFKDYIKSKGDNLNIYIQDGANLLSSIVTSPVGEYFVAPTFITKSDPEEILSQKELAISDPLSKINPGVMKCLDLFGLDESDILQSQINNLNFLKEVLLETSIPGKFKDSINDVPMIENMLLFPNLQSELEKIPDENVIKNISKELKGKYPFEQVVYIHKLYNIYKNKLNSLSSDKSSEAGPSAPFRDSSLTLKRQSSEPLPPPPPPAPPEPPEPPTPVPSGKSKQILPPKGKELVDLSKNPQQVEFLKEKEELNTRIELIPYEQHLLDEANLEKDRIQESQKLSLQKKIDELKRSSEYRDADAGVREAMIQSISTGDKQQFVRLNINIYSLLEYLQDSGFNPHESRALEKFSTFFEGDLSKWTVLDPPGNGFCTIYSAILSKSEFPYPLSIANDDLKQDNIIKSIINGIEKYYVETANYYLRENNLFQLNQILTIQEYIELKAPVEERNEIGQWQEKEPGSGFDLGAPPLKKDKIYSLNIGHELNNWRMTLAKDLEKLKPLTTTPPALLRFLAYIINKNIIGLGFAPQGDIPFLATIYKSLTAPPDEYTIIHTRGAHTVAIVYPLMNETTTLDEYLQNKKLVKDTISKFLEESSLDDEGLSRNDKGLDLWTDNLLAKEIEQMRSKQKQIYDDEMLAKKLQQEEAGSIGGRITKKQKYSKKKLNTRKIKRKKLRKATKKRKKIKRKTKKH